MPRDHIDFPLTAYQAHRASMNSAGRPGFSLRALAMALALLFFGAPFTRATASGNGAPCPMHSRERLPCHAMQSGTAAAKRGHHPFCHEAPGIARINCGCGQNRELTRASGDPSVLPLPIEWRVALTTCAYRSPFAVNESRSADPPDRPPPRLSV